jgi:hypothetical protein
MDTKDISGGMLVRRTSTGKLYRVKAALDGGALVTVNEHGTWVSVVGQRDGRDFGRVFGFRPGELEPAARIQCKTHGDQLVCLSCENLDAVNGG